MALLELVSCDSCGLVYDIHKIPWEQSYHEYTPYKPSTYNKPMGVYYPSIECRCGAYIENTYCIE